MLVAIVFLPFLLTTEAMRILRFTGDSLSPNRQSELKISEANAGEKLQNRTQQAMFDRRVLH